SGLIRRCRPLTPTLSPPAGGGRDPREAGGGGGRAPREPECPLGRSGEVEADGYRGAGDDRDIAGCLIGDVEPALDDPHRDLAVRQRSLDPLSPDLGGALDPDRDLDLHRLRIDAEAADQ